MLPAHGSGGAKATIKLKPQKNRASLSSEKKQKDKKTRLRQGYGRVKETLVEYPASQARRIKIFALLRLELERFRFSLIKRNTKQKNFLFLLKEKMTREKIKKCRENYSVLFCCSGAKASGNAPHYYFGFSLKKVRISFRVRSQIVCSVFL